MTQPGPSESEFTRPSRMSGQQAQDRRGVGERRRYNRRTTDEISPPYYQVFDRIATALEHIEELLRQRQ